MSKEKFAQAKAFIQQKRYDEARNILKGINHPQAKEWIARLDQIQPSKKRFPVWIAAAPIIGILLVAGAFFTGRATVQPTDRNQIETEVVGTLVAGIEPVISVPTSTFTPVLTLTPTNTPTSTPTPTPVSTGGVFSYQGGSLRVLEFQFPSGFTIHEASLSGFADSALLPVAGTEFASIEFEFTCPSNEVICESIPNAVVSLIMQDGRIVLYEELFALEGDSLGAEDVAGGGVTRGWITYQVPTDSPVKFILIETLDKQKAFMDLPSPVDGFTKEHEWQVTSSGIKTRPIPVLLRQLLTDGYNVLAVRETETASDHYISILSHTDELLFFDDAEVISDTQSLVLKTISLWDFSELDFLAISILNDLDETAGIMFIDTPEILQYANGNLSLAEFQDTWLVSVEG